MLLYSAPSSYYSMIARLALLESNTVFELRRMDIHIAKEQLSSWYEALNPAMTVPTLTNGDEVLTDSRDILKFAASNAGEQWLDVDLLLAQQINDLVEAHYAITIERLTFGKALARIPPLRVIVPHMLSRIIRQLNKELPSTANPKATEAKIVLNQERLAYFTEGSLADKLMTQRQEVIHYLNKLPTPCMFLFGDKPSSADIVTAVLLGRLKMIGEYDLVKPFPALVAWFERMQARPAFTNADIWLRFKPWRIILKY
jgi:glutathione S-transferase